MLAPVFMKLNLTLIITVSLCFIVLSGPAQNLSREGRVTGAMNFEDSGLPRENCTLVSHLLDSREHDARLIEPTSPILGAEMAKFIKEHAGHPLEILNDIYETYPSFNKEVIASSIAYFNTMIPGLIEYNSRVLASTISEEGHAWTEVETASIPLEILLPLHDAYRTNLTDAISLVESEGYSRARDSAVVRAVEYGNQKMQSSTVLPILRPGNIYARVLPGKIGRLIELNAVISSAEAAYPRVQHSINGYLQHIYNYLLGHDDLVGLLNTTYNAQSEWIERARQGTEVLPFLAHIEKRIVEAGYSYRDALMVLCYSSRNMPSLDVQYTMNPDKTLNLEVFFWKLKVLQNEATTNHFKNVFPNHEFKVNPMLYHYATASYLAYEVERAGYRNATAIGMAFLSKAGYKLHKFICGLDKSKLKTTGEPYIHELIRKQSSLSGIEAGYFGGLHGVDMARMEDRQSSKASGVIQSLYERLLTSRFAVN